MTCCARACRESRDIITIPGIINRDFADVKTTMAGMGHAVMGTAVRSGSNRAIEAAQAAMASPLLEAGAIDGARGILINITGSSSLKLSEVNEASTLIQSAAHEDANIIFGAVLDEKMGEEVKITVIATGFRDQMPERRARMLSVEEAPVVSVPLVAVPVEAPDNWLQEEEPAAASTDPSGPADEFSPTVLPRFKSQDEDEQAETGESDRAFFFSSSRPAVATTVTVAGAPARTQENDDFFEEKQVETGRVETGQAATSMPRFDEVKAEPGASVQARERRGMRAGENTQVASLQAGQVEQDAQPSASMLAEGAEGVEEPQHRDLDVPAFLRRFQF